MNAPCSGAPLTAPHVTTGGLCRWKAINNKVGRHVGLDFYDLLIEGDYLHRPSMSDMAISRRQSDSQARFQGLSPKTPPNLLFARYVSYYLAARSLCKRNSGWG